MPKPSVLAGVSATPLVSGLGVTRSYLRSPARGGSGRQLAGSSVTRSTNAPAVFTPGSTGGGNSGDINYRYVGPTPLGNGQGMDWSNRAAWGSVAFQRGMTYYLMSGTYSGDKIFNTAALGSTLITLKKATIADHGEDISGGWNASTMGSGQAVFTGAWYMFSNYWVFDGAERDENNWFDGTKYGFRIANNTGSQIIFYDFNLGAPAAARSSLTFRYIHCDASVSVPVAAVRWNSIDTDPYNSAVFSTGLTFSRMFINGSCNHWMIRGSTGTVIEYSAASNATGNENNHGEIVNLYYTANNTVIRHNHFKNNYVGGGGTALIACTFTSGHQIYGNLFENWDSGDGAIGFIGGDMSNTKIYNNTFVKCTTGGGIQASAGSGNEIRNNLWVGVSSPSINVGAGATITHNAFSNASGSGTSAQTSVPTSIFVNYAGGDYRLASATQAGFTLASPYNVDRLGNTRGADGTWDRGAYEKV